MERRRESRLDHGLHYAELGYKSFPLRVRVQPSEDGTLEKKLFPVLDWPRVATCDRAKVESWWGDGQAWSTASIGIATGQSGIAVIDPDGPEGLSEWQQIRDLYGISDNTPHYSTPGGGQHWWYRTDPERPLPTGAKTVGDHIDTRGGYGPDGNGLVIVPPSTDDRGAYRWIVEPVALDDLPPVPEAVYALIDDRKGIKPREADPEQALSGDGTRRYTLAQAQAFIRPAIEAIERADKGTRNDRLNDAARVAAHFGGEFWSRAQAEQRLTELARERGLDPKEIADTIDSAYKAQARDYASGEVDKHGRPKGWTATYVEPSPFGDDEEGEEVDEEEKLLAREVDAQRRRLKAKRIVSAEGREPLRVMRGAAFLNGPQLSWLVPGVAYHASTTKIFGPPGGGKTNFMLDIALRLATGLPWRGHKLERVPVHFVMAEGESVNRLRVEAFLRKNELEGKDLDGWWTAIPQGVLLTPEGIEDYLPLVRQDRPGLVVLDTKNAMMDGNENDAGDVAVMIRAMRQIRDLGGRTCVALIDHTGLGDQSRGRGSNAVEGAMDTEIRVTKARQGSLTVFTAESTRDKAGSEDRPSWTFTLWPVDVPREEGIEAPPVVEADDAALRAAPPPAPAERQWYEIPLLELPDPLLDLVGPGKEAARDAYRVLLGVNDPDGLTTAQVRDMLGEAVGKVKSVRKYSKTSFNAGFASLKKQSLVGQGATPSRWVAVRFAPTRRTDLGDPNQPTDLDRVPRSAATD
jgi:hypothetical protein